MKLKIEIDTSASAAKVEVISIATGDAGDFGSAIADIGCLLVGREKNPAKIDVVYNGMVNTLLHDNAYAFRSFSHGFGLCGQIMASLNPIGPELSSVPKPPTSTQEASLGSSSMFDARFNRENWDREKHSDLENAVFDSTTLPSEARRLAGLSLESKSAL